MLLTKYRFMVKEVVARSGIKRLFYGLSIYLVFLLFVVMVNYAFGNRVNNLHYITSFYSFILLIPVTLTCSLYIVARSQYLNYRLSDLMKTFIYAGLIQVFIALLALFIPTIKDQLVSLMYTNTQDVLLGTQWIADRRYFGFANSMLDLFGFGMGILAVLALFLYRSMKRTYVILFVLLLIPAVLNARTGIIIAMLGLAIFVLFMALRLNISQIFYAVMLTTLLFVFGYFLVANIAPNTADWVYNDINSFNPLRSEEVSSTGTADKLFSAEFWTLPDAKYLLFGTGHSLYQAAGFRHSDVGYINDLWRSGILGMLLLYAPFLVFFRQAIDWKNSKEISALIVFFIVSMGVFLVKGSIWVYSPGILAIISITAYSIYLRRKPYTYTRVEP